MKAYETCTGCAACASVCPKQAISMQPNAEGFLFPVTDAAKCVHCGLCDKVCGAAPEKHSLLQAFAVQNQNQDILRTSTSGGAASALCLQILGRNGLVYAASYSVEEGPHWLRIDDASKLSQIRGSKYLQIGLTPFVIQSLTDDLADHEVLFIGTPCQVDGVKKVVPEKNRNHLLLVDIICGGVISPDIEKRYENYLQSQKGQKPVKRDFRWKEQGRWESTYCSRTVYEDGSEVMLRGGEDLYTRAYTSERLLRESCYTCPYATMERTGDLTLGDCWGIEKESFSFPNAERGVSLVLANTERGKQFLSSLGDLVRIPLENGYPLERNKPLHHPTKRHGMRKAAYKLYHALPFETATGIVAYRYTIKKMLKGKENP